MLWWIFGIATTVLLISLWGRSVAGDQRVVVEAASELAKAELVTEQVVAWLVGGLDLAPATAQSPVREIVSSPEMQQAAASLVEEVVAAAYEPAAPPVDVGEILQPVAPLVTEELQAFGIAATEAQVLESLSRLPPITLAAEQASPPIAETVKRPLSTATVLAALTMVMAAAFMLTFSQDRLATARGLALRIAVSGVSFAVILRLASWIADPGAGGSPLRRTLSVLLAASPEVPLVIGLLGAVLLSLTVLKRRSGLAR